MTMVRKHKPLGGLDTGLEGSFIRGNNRPGQLSTTYKLMELYA